MPKKASWPVRGLIGGGNVRLQGNYDFFVNKMTGEATGCFPWTQAFIGGFLVSHDRATPWPCGTESEGNVRNDQ